MPIDAVTSSNLSDLRALRDEIAAVAARFIAEDGLDYAGAKDRAVRVVMGGRRGRDCLPDNAQVEAAVREHQALFMADTQPARLAHLRRVARDVMRLLRESPLDLNPVVVGAIVNGTAGEHSEVHLQVHDASAKDVEIFLLNAGIDFDVREAAGRHGGETVSFLWPQRRVVPSTFGGDRSQEAVHLSILDPRDRALPPNLASADLDALDRLIANA
jgi:hypothetical protein